MRLVEITPYDIMEDPEYVWLWEMAAVTPDMSGVPYVMYISPEQSSHEARVKVCNVPGKLVPTDMFSIRLHDLEIVGTCKLNADELERVRWWIHRNKFALLDYWKNRINTQQALNALRPITETDVGP